MSQFGGNEDGWIDGQIYAWMDVGWWIACFKDGWTHLKLCDHPSLAVLWFPVPTVEHATLAPDQLVP